MKDDSKYYKIQKAIEDSSYDGLLVTGADNVQYLCGAPLPFLYAYPSGKVIVLWFKNGFNACVSPVKFESTLRRLSWVKSIKSYRNITEKIQLIKKIVEDNCETSIIGCDMRRAPAYYIERLTNTLPDFKLRPCDELLDKLRMNKTSKEIEVIKDIARRTDHGLVGAAHHVIITVSKTEMALAEDIRVHCLERGLDIAGQHNLSQVASGEHVKKFWPLAPKYGIGWEKMLKEGEMVRLEMRGYLHGYWSDDARMMIMGEPTEEQLESYEQLSSLLKQAKKIIGPGIKCNHIYRELLNYAEKNEIDLVTDKGLGHGVGVSDIEAPFIRKYDDTVLKPGMILIIDPVVLSNKGEVLRSKDTVLITETGCKVIGWYKDWRRPYIPAYTL